ncbi:hypothetical protein KX816_13740 [Sphingosinicellaceae bacterium]|nr:hypothetical protein KX816_13740 [Sphingosinicellaceae bacterium]
MAEHLTGPLQEVRRPGRDENAAFNFAILRPSLVELIGSGGYAMLISNALSHAQCETPWLREVSLGRDGAFVGLDAAYAKVSCAEFRSASALILTHILNLLVRFIGPVMTDAVVRDTWPTAPVESLVWVLPSDE